MWVFGYGSLMWDKWEEDHDYRRHSIAELQGFQRTFNKASTKNWGTKDMPCPTLNLEANPSASCKGVAFEFGDDKRDRLLRYLKEREGEDFELQEHQIRLKDGESIVAVVPIYVGKNRLSEIDLANSAAIVRAAKGERGVCFDYVRSVFDALSKLGIEDPAVTRFWQAIQESV